MNYFSGKMLKFMAFPYITYWKHTLQGLADPNLMYLRPNELFQWENAEIHGLSLYNLHWKHTLQGLTDPNLMYK